MDASVRAKNRAVQNHIVVSAVVPFFRGVRVIVGRKPRCEVGVFIFGQPGFHNAAAVGCVVFLSHGRDLLSCRMSAAGISGASRIAGFGEGTPQQDSRRGKMSEKRILVLR